MLQFQLLKDGHYIFTAGHLTFLEVCPLLPNKLSEVYMLPSRLCWPHWKIHNKVIAVPSVKRDGVEILAPTISFIIIFFWELSFIIDSDCCLFLNWKQINGRPVHEAPTITGLESIKCLCAKRLFLWIEPMTSSSQYSNLVITPRLTLRKRKQMLITNSFTDLFTFTVFCISSNH